MQVTVYGSSDDLIEIEGDIREEFSYDNGQEEGDLLAFSDGTIVRIKYSDQGVWRISLVNGGLSHYSHVTAPEDDDDNYSDRLVLGGDADTIRWVVQGVAWAHAS